MNLQVKDGFLMRFQFLEAVVRVSMFLNKEKPKEDRLSPADALKEFIVNDILPNTQDIWDEWDTWRTKTLWTLEGN